MALSVDLEPTILATTPAMYWPLQDASQGQVQDLGWNPHPGIAGNNTTPHVLAGANLGFSFGMNPAGAGGADLIYMPFSTGDTQDQVVFFFFKMNSLDNVNNRFLFYWGTWGANGWGMYRNNGTHHLVLAGQPAGNTDTGFVLDDVVTWHSLHVGWVGGIWGVTFDGVYKNYPGFGWNGASQNFDLGGNTGYGQHSIDADFAHFAAWIAPGATPSTAQTNSFLAVQRGQPVYNVGTVSATNAQLLTDLNAILAAVRKTF